MSNLIFIGGLSLLFGGVLWLITSILHPNNHEPKATTSRYWQPAIGGQAVAYLLLVPGVAGLHVVQADETGVLGLVGFFLSLLGSALTFATNLNMTFLLPSLMAEQATPKTVTEMLGPSGPLKWFSLLTASYLITFVPGFILIGVAVLNGGVLPALAGWLLIVGMVVSNIGAVFKPIFILRNLGGIIFGIGLAWLGLAVMAG